MNDIPYSVRSGSMTIFGVEIQFHVLSDGQRVVTQESFDRFAAALAQGPSSEEAQDAIKQLRAIK